MTERSCSTLQYRKECEKKKEKKKLINDNTLHEIFFCCFFSEDRTNVWQNKKFVYKKCISFFKFKKENSMHNLSSTK